MKYNTGDKVIVNLQGSLIIGRIIKTFKRSNKYCYNIFLENGSVFNGISIDNQKSMIFIDSKHTNLLIGKIKSNIDNSYENFRRNASGETITYNQKPDSST